MPPELFAALGGVLGIAASAVGIVVAVYQIKKLKTGTEPDGQSYQPLDGGGRIVMPTLDEIIQYGGNARAYEEARKERAHQAEFHGGGPLDPLYMLAVRCVTGRFLTHVFRIAIPEDAQLELPRLRAARGLLRLSGAGLSVSSLLLVLLYLFAVFGVRLNMPLFPRPDCAVPGLCATPEAWIITIGSLVLIVISGLLALAWAALWKKVLGV